MIIRPSLARDVGRLFVWYPLRWSAAGWPHGLAIGMGRRAARLMCRLRPGATAGLVESLRQVFPEHDDARLRRIAVGCVEHHLINLTQLFRYPHLRRGDIERTVRFQGLDHLDAALAAGRGAVLVHMHFGTMQMPTMALALRGYPTTQVGRRDPAEEGMSWVVRNVSFRLRVELEDNLAFRHVLINESIRPAYRALEHNELVLTAGDGLGGGLPPGSSYRPIEMLGRQVLLPPGPAALARRTGAALLPLVCTLDARDRYQVVIEPPVDVPRTRDREADTLAAMRQVASVFEHALRAHPDHWALWEEFTGSRTVGPS